MTVKELRELLAKYPDGMEVFMAERKTDFAFGLVNRAYAKEIKFSEEPGSSSLAKDTVLILDEE